MITLQQAVLKALEFLQSIYPEQEEIRVEEIETEEDKSAWLITFSLPIKTRKTLSPFSMQQTEIVERDYKTCKVNAITGEVISMKIRTLDA